MAAVAMLVNGAAGDLIPVLDRGFQYGDGLFETIKLAGGVPEFWDRHMARLASGCKTLAIPAPDAALLRREADKVCAGHSEGVLKIIVTRGIGGRGYSPPEYAVPSRVVALYPAPDYPDSFARDGVKLRMCETLLSEQPRLAGLKHLNRLEQVLARGEWRDPEIAEGIMCDASGAAIEGTMSNLFLVRGGKLATPDLSRCGVAGIMRAVVLDIARERGIAAAVRRVAEEELEQAEEIFVTNSVIGLWPVRMLGSRKLRPGAITAELKIALAETARS
jgi:4-amino-4-deoxychorismate lyase